MTIKEGDMVLVGQRHAQACAYTRVVGLLLPVIQLYLAVDTVVVEDDAGRDWHIHTDDAILITKNKDAACLLLRSKYNES